MGYWNETWDAEEEIICECTFNVWQEKEEKWMNCAPFVIYVGEYIYR